MPEPLFPPPPIPSECPSNNFRLSRSVPASSAGGSVCSHALYLFRMPFPSGSASRARMARSCRPWWYVQLHLFTFISANRLLLCRDTTISTHGRPINNRPTPTEEFIRTSAILNITPHSRILASRAPRTTHKGVTINLWRPYSQIRRRLLQCG